MDLRGPTKGEGDSPERPPNLESEGPLTRAATLEPSKVKGKVYRLTAGDPGEPELTVREITGTRTTLLVEVGIGTQAHLAVIDTGAQVTVISDTMVHTIRVPSEVLEHLPNAKLKGFGKTGFVQGKRGLNIYSE